MTTEAIAAAETAAPPITPAKGLWSSRFLLFFSAQTATVVAEMFSYVALAWVTIQLTGSGAAVGAVLATQAIPRGVLMLFGGAISDRFTPIRVMMASAAARALVLGVFAALVIGGHAQAWEIFVVAAALGAISAFFYPARQSALPSVVEPAQIQPANAWVFMATQASIVVGPALAGLLVARAGSGPAFVIDAAGYGLAFIGLLPVAGTAGAGARKGSAGLVAEVLAGLRYMWESTLTRTVLAVIIVLNFAVNGPFEVGITVLARQRWGGAFTLGAMIGAFGIGSLVGALAVRKLKLPLGWGLIAVCAAFGIGFPLIGLFPVAWPAAVVTALIGVVNASVSIIGISWLQTRTPAELMGRVMAVVMTGVTAVAPLSYAIAGALVPVSVELVFALGGALSLLVAIVAVGLKTVREAE